MTLLILSIRTRSMPLTSQVFNSFFKKIAFANPVRQESGIAGSGPQAHRSATAGMGPSPAWAAQ